VPGRRAAKHLMNEHVEPPLRHNPQFDIINKYGVEVDSPARIWF
jgi:hypothetical protein